MKTRISGIERFSFDKKFPILLERDSYFTELIVLDTRVAYLGSGVHSILIIFVLIIGLLKYSKLSYKEILH